MRDFKVVTVCNRRPAEPYYCLDAFIKSLGDNEPLVLGTQPGEYTGLGSKVKLLYKAIREGLIQEEYIIYCDCFDLVFTIDPIFLFENYLECFGFGSRDIVISSEKNCFPENLREEYNLLPYTSTYKYLNSGMIVGSTSNILEALISMEVENIPEDYRMEDGNMFHVNDQFLWQQIFLKQPVPMKLDYSQILCNTLHNVKSYDLRFTDKRIFNRETEKAPSSFHFNGSAKTDGLMRPILKHLNL